MPTGNAVGALTFAYYILQPIFPTCEPPESAVRMIAALAISESKSFMGATAPLRHIGLGYMSICHLFWYKRNVVRCVHLRQVMTGLIYCLRPPPLSIFLDQPPFIGTLINRHGLEATQWLG